MPDTVLITGASKGLGRCLAQAFAADGYRLILHGRDRERLAETAKHVPGGEALSTVGDLRSAEYLEELSRLAQREQVRVLINNAAMICPGLPLPELSPAQISEMIETNLLAVIRLTQSVYSFMRENGRGVIININSLAGLEAKKFRTLYCASKFGLRGFTNALRLEAAESGVHVFGVYFSKIKLSEEDPFGMPPAVAVERVLDAARAPEEQPAEVVVDERPVEFR